jgi:chemotaxis family two-component system response regulator Rcp1
MHTPQSVRSIEILLVEDNPGDVRLTQEALDETKLSNNLRVVSNGGEALKFLRREDPFVDAPRPDLVLLDLNLPLKNGLETLSEMKGEPSLRSIPVIVLTTSEAEEDIVRAYDMNANCYISKPVDMNQFIKVVKAIEKFWFTIVELPERRE